MSQGQFLKQKLLLLLLLSYLIIINNKANPCWKSNCSKSGTCDYNSTINNFTCNCFNGYNGTFCQNCKHSYLFYSINILLIIMNNN